MYLQNKKQSLLFFIITLNGYS
uniref:Uncharacterized protein n=1 Tax=Arundo donax TaxID=35708 RepID=A0A0A9BUR7_ARUDO